MSEQNRGKEASTQGPRHQRVDYAISKLPHAPAEPPNQADLPEALTYDLMSHGGQATVCAAAPKETARSDKYQSEAELEAAFIAQLRRQAYEYIQPESEDALLANLRHQLEALNNLEFTDAEWQRFFRVHIAGESDGILEKTRRIQEDYIQSFRRDDGTTKNIWLIDKTSIHNNRLQVMNQYTQKGAHENRYDVTIVVNGLPLVHVELKRRGVAIKEAFNQIERYQRDSFWSGCGLFEYVQIFVISNGTHTKYYSNTTRMSHIEEARTTAGGAHKKTSHSFEFTSWWASTDNVPICDLVPFTSSFFAKHTLLAILTRYCVFTEEGLLLVMRPYQIAATESILNRILISESNKDLLGTPAAGGYVWHTTGSGKTLTSFKTARLASGMEGVDKVLFVVDRKDLDYQTMREYDKFEKGAVDGSDSTAVLARHLADPEKRILVTTIQKLACFIRKNPQHAVYAQHVVILFDECHRSQFGEMHTAIAKRFKNYHLFGFTGTPISTANMPHTGNVHLRTTEQAFGDKLHTYTIVDAIRDGNVLPFRIDYIKTIKERDEFPDAKVYDIYREGAYRASERVDLIVNYILDHYAQKTKRHYTYKLKGKPVQGFNSLFCVSSIDMAKVYYAAFKRIQAKRGGAPLKVATIFSFQANEADEGCGLPGESFDTGSLDTPSREFLDAAMADYNALFSTNFSTDGDGFQNYYKDLSQRLKDRSVDLVIVVNMFLTGFDATTLNTLWVDKDLRMHGLIQAFSRTNRILNSVKDFGNIVCFRNLEDEVNSAISLFGDGEAGGVVLLKPYAEYLAEYCNHLADLQARFPVGEVILGEEAEKEFIRLFGIILRLRNVLVCFDEFAADDPLSARDEQDWRSVYVDLYEKWRRPSVDSTIINDDLVFEVELMKTVDITIDYVLMLVQKYHDTNCRDKVIVADIERAIGSAPALRNKRELVHAFIDSLESSDNVLDDWKRYVAEAKESELCAIIADESLDEAATRALVERAFAEGGIPEVGTEVTALMKRKPSRFAPESAYAALKQQVVERLRAFFERFAGLG